MLLISTQTTLAIFSALLFLEATEIILFIGFFTGSTGTVKAGGYVGVVTALIAWYALGGRCDQWPWGPAQDAGRQAAHQLARPARNLFSA